MKYTAPNSIAMKNFHRTSQRTTYNTRRKRGFQEGSVVLLEMLQVCLSDETLGELIEVFCVTCPGSFCKDQTKRKYINQFFTIHTIIILF